MSKEIKNKLLQSGKLALAALLLISSNQTASFASGYTNDFQEELSLSKQHTLKISSLHNNKADPSGHYSVKIYSANKPKLISAITRQLTGSITDVMVEDINDDAQPDIIVMMESYSRGKQYLVIDTFSFDGKEMVWKQQLPENFISVKTNSYLKNHQIPNKISRNTATALLY